MKIFKRIFGIFKRVFAKRNAPAWIAALASGCALVSAFPPFAGRLAVFFALAPLLTAVRLGISPRKSAFFFFAAGMVFWPASLSWFPAIIPNGGPWPLVVLGWLGLSAVCSLFFALFGWLDARVWRAAGDAPSAGRFAAVVSEAILWAGAEWLRANIFSGFAWNFLGVPLGAYPQIAGVARWGGVYAVSALAVLVSGAAAGLAARALRPLTRLPPASRSPKARILASAESWFALAAAAAAVFACGTGVPAGEKSIPVSVALLQRDFPCVLNKDAVRSDGAAAYRRLLETATDDAGRGVWNSAPGASAESGECLLPDLVLMPESALCEIGPQSARRLVRDLSAIAGGASILAGSDDAGYSPEGDIRIYNAAALFTPRGGGAFSIQTYRKRHLVPFGEYIPLDKTFPALQSLCPLGTTIWPGETSLVELKARASEKPIKIAPLICFEDTDAALARKAAADGAQMLALMTNDNWFRGSVESVQHFEQSVFRAIETGLPLVRTGNSGVTGVVFPDGSRRILQSPDGSPLVDAQGSMLATLRVPDSPRATPYVRAGDAPLCILFALCALAAFVLPRLRKW